MSIGGGECSSRVCCRTPSPAASCIDVDGSRWCFISVDDWWREREWSALSEENAEEAVLLEPSGGGQCSSRVCSRTSLSAATCIDVDRGGGAVSVSMIGGECSCRMCCQSVQEAV